MGTDQRLNNPISIPTREEPSRRKSDGAGNRIDGGDLTAGPIPRPCLLAYVLTAPRCQRFVE
jgi:hypothetical protein